MAITSSGYDGTVDEVQWAKMARHNGVEYAVAGPNDWKVEAQAGIDRGIKIAPGTGFGHGILDVSDAQVTMQMNTVGSGSRWDLVTMRRDWQPPGGTSVFTKITGSATKVIPGGRLYNPGVLDDQPLALVQSTAGQSAVTSIIDLRTSASKIISVTDLIALPNAPLGTIANVQGNWYERKLDASLNPAWVNLLSTNNLQVATTGFLSSGAGWTTNGGSGVTLKNRAMRQGNLIQLNIEFRRSGAAIDLSRDALIAEIQPPFLPDQIVPLAAVYYTPSTSYPATLQLSPGGGLSSAGATPSTPVNPRDTGVSLRVHGFFMTEKGV